MEERSELPNIDPDFYKRRARYRTLNMTSVGTDYYCVFVFFSLMNSFTLFFETFVGIKVTRPLFIFFAIISALLALSSYNSDMLSVDALTKSDAQAKKNITRSKIAFLFTAICYISYMLSAFANARFVPSLTENIEDDTTRFIVNALGYILVSTLSIPYNNMFNDDSMINTLNAISNMYHNPKRYWKKFKANTGACLEAAYQTFGVNPTYRGIKDAAAVTGSLPLYIPILKSDSPVTLFVASVAMVSTFLMTFVCRCEATFEKHIPKENQYVSINGFHYFKDLSKGKKFSIFTKSVLLRALPLGYIIYCASPSSYYLNYALGGFLSLLMGTLSHFALTEEALYEVARKEISLEEILVSQNTFAFNYGTTTAKNSSQQTPEQKFDAYAQEFATSRPWILSGVSKNNWASRGSRFLIFPPFVYNLAYDYTGRYMSGLLLFCWWIEFGLPVLATDKDNFDKKVTQNLLRIITKCYIEIETFKKYADSLNFFSYYFYYVKAIVTAIFTKSVYDYDIDAFKKSMDAVKTTEVPADNHNNQQASQPLLQQNNYQGYSAPKSVAASLASSFRNWSRLKDENDPTTSLPMGPQQV